MSHPSLDTPRNRDARDEYDSQEHADCHPSDPWSAPSALRPYAFHHLPLGGTKREGRSNTLAPNLNPYDSELLTTNSLARCLELDGNCRLFVLANSNVNLTVRAGIAGSYPHQRQIRTRTNCIRMRDSVHEEFLDKFSKRALALETGAPAYPDTDLGPVINETQFDSIMQKVDPKCDEDALRIANDTECGLSSAVFTQDLERGMHFAKRIDSPISSITDRAVHVEANTALRGKKTSAVRQFLGARAIAAFPTSPWLSTQQTPHPHPL